MILNCGYRSWTDVWLVLNGDRGVPSNLQGTVEAFAECNLAELQHKFQAHRGQVAAVFLDIQRSAPPVGYLAAVKELCHTNWALLVYDEIVTGFRLALGEMQEYCGVMPDLACFAKALSNGMPLACVASHAEVMVSMQDRVISVTYGGEALSVAAAIASLRELRDKGVNAYLWDLGEMLQRGLNDASMTPPRKLLFPFIVVGLPR